MSQAKVDRYKQEKANREKIMKRERRVKTLEILVAVIVVVGLLTWFGVAVYNNTKANADASASAEANVTELKLDDAYNYINDLQTSVAE